ncbi:uncharacterized protein LOC125238442 [Leguminivora glycinivorella]|uniref:uncharacterized protein LOC125238442 n=1 Tax=Leguminivora glycinivorella TaxID=1035111 RepID=UPI00200C5080|nr:uncharacterized protein LOC125238442 [Leguminivora glycinivorella]
MQMYDKIADCVYLFNKIYAGQVFFMFQSGLNCTMLLICRFLSPSLKVDKGYLNQIQTMFDLVQTRKMEVTTNIFPVNLQTILNFFGRLISFTVLMIQYFYMHVFNE